jgi:hypothetical protein
MELDKILERQFSGNAESRAAGMIINTMGWVEGLEYEVSTCFEKERKKWTLMSFFFFQSHWRLILYTTNCNSLSLICSYFSMQLKPSRPM